jgi:catechol 2,3-dioxygenase-like lactoylglutathione lyase family enzyme
MIDHVTIRVPDLTVGRRFYGRALELLGHGDLMTAGVEFAEWDDFSIAEAGIGESATTRLHIGFRAPSRGAVDAWWTAMTEDGYPSDGVPGPRPVYGHDYYGAFVADPAGNSVEAVHDVPARGAGVLDHLWIRVADLDESTRFYETIAPVVDLQVVRVPAGSTPEVPERALVTGDGAVATVSLMVGEATRRVHLAFAAPDRATVAAFHRLGTSAGFVSMGEPGERPQYHPGYYGAYLSDPDGHNVEAVFHDRP